MAASFSLTYFVFFPIGKDKDTEGGWVSKIEKDKEVIKNFYKHIDDNDTIDKVYEKLRYFYDSYLQQAFLDHLL